LFEQLQKPRAPEGLPAAAVPPRPAAVATGRRSGAGAPGRGPAAAAKPVPLAERELQPKALLRVRADVVDRLVNRRAKSPSRAAGSKAKCARSSGHAGTPPTTSYGARAAARDRIQAESQMQSRQELAKESIREFDPLEFDRFPAFQEVTR